MSTSGVYARRSAEHGEEIPVAERGNEETVDMYADRVPKTYSCFELFHMSSGRNVKTGNVHRRGQCSG